MKKLILFLLIGTLILFIGCKSKSSDIKLNQEIPNKIQDDAKDIEKVMREYANAFKTENIELCAKSVNWNKFHSIDPEEAARITCSEWISTGQKFEVVSVEDIQISGNTATASVTYLDLSTNEEFGDKGEFIKINNEWKVDIKIPE